LSWKPLSIPLAAGALLTAVFFTDHDAANFDRRLPVGPGGAIAVDIALGSGISFDHGSLTIRSHAEDDLRVLAETSGWGKYAVDLDLSHQGEQAALVGRVDGPLDWLFGGPTVNVSIWVPADFSVKASLHGGPLLLEDLTGPITARVEEDVVLRRAEGRVRLASRSGSVEVRDVDGDLEVKSERGDVDIGGVRGSVVVTAGRGSVEIESVSGPVNVESDQAQVEIDDVRGDVSVTTERGAVDLEEIEGSVFARTNRGGIYLEDIDGAVRAQSVRGSIEVDFEGTPHGVIETERGEIEIEFREGASFDLDARTEQGRVRLGDAAEEYGDDDSADLEASDDSEDTSHHKRGLVRFRGEEVARAINGGGETLRLRSGRGSIRIRD